MAHVDEKVHQKASSVTELFVVALFFSDFFLKSADTGIIQQLILIIYVRN